MYSFELARKLRPLVENLNIILSKVLNNLLKATASFYARYCLNAF